MNEFDGYIDRIFRNIVRSKQTKTLKVQMKAGAEEKYKILVSEGTDKSEAVHQVLSEIGTQKDLEAEYPVSNKHLNIIACILLVLLALSVLYTLYVQQNLATFQKHYLLAPLYRSSIIFIPMIFFSSTYLVLWLINRFSFNMNQFLLNKKTIRIPILLLALALLPCIFS